MKISKAIVLLQLLSLPAFASECDFDYKLKVRVAASKGHFDVDNQGSKDNYSETHNNASTAGGSLAYKCGETSLKYTHHSVIKIPGIDSLSQQRIVNTYTISNPKFGSFTYGKMVIPYRAPVKPGDPFWDTPAGTVFAANNFGFSNMSRGFTDKSYIYQSPEFANFFLTFGYSGVNSEGDWHHGLEYKQGKSTAGIHYLNLGEDSFVANGGGSNEAVRLFGRHQTGDWLFAGSVENVRKDTGAKEVYLNVSVQKDIQNFGRVAASYGHVTDANLRLINGSTHDGHGYGVSVGGFYNWIENSEIYLLASALTFSDDAEQKSLVLGISYTFSL